MTASVVACGEDDEPRGRLDAVVAERARGEPLQKSGGVQLPRLGADTEHDDAAVTVDMPATTVGFTPIRDATIPLGTAPKNVPAGYAAASVSTKMTALVKTRRRFTPRQANLSRPR